MRRGAQDYVLKDRMSRLPEVIRRCLSEVEQRRQRQEAEAALREREEQLRVSLEAAQMGAWDWDVERDRMRWIGVEQLFGMTPGQQFSGTLVEFLELIVPEDREAVKSVIRASLTHGSGFTVQYRVRTPAGELRWLEAQGRMYGGDGGACRRRMAGTVADITARRSLEEQLLHSQKMEAIGRLAGGVAHDFNNLLTVILTHAVLAERALNGLSVARDHVAPIREAGERAALLTRQLLAFSRKERIDPAVVDVNQLVQGVAHMLRRLVGDDVELRLDLGADAGMVYIDPGQLEQVLVNLLVNARDALPRGGTVQIATSSEPAESRGGQVVGLGPWVVLRVTDDGVGVPVELQARIFEPFFTTKDVGRGSGLGLAICHSIVSAAGGRIAVRSAPGAGASFIIHLPRSQQPAAAAAPPAQRDPESAASAAVTVLLVEDDEFVRRASERVLRSASYCVLVAACAEEALELATSYPGRLDLLLTDVVMPRMSGVELARRVEVLRPGTRVLYTSGYTGTELLTQAFEPTQLLAKPFAPDVLLARIRDALAAR
jgi:PAS domain S-box-containing protein